jgi:4-carboxymuconolactone decarboxylase
MSADRMPPIPEDEQSEAQKDAAAELIAGPRGALAGPFVPLLRSPELMGRVQKLGTYLRFESPLPEAVKELAVLMAARHWNQAYEWAFHLPLARQAGLSRAACEAISGGGRPEDLSPGGQVAYDLLHETLTFKAVSDATYRHAELAFGQQGIVELTALCGYYGLLALVMNAAQTPAPMAEIPLR